MKETTPDSTPATTPAVMGLSPETLFPQTVFLLADSRQSRISAHLLAAQFEAFQKAMRERDTGYRLVYVCSPYRADSKEEIERNVNYAIGCSEFTISQARVPLAPHLLYTRFLNDEVADDRIIGMICAGTLLRRCDEIWVFGEYGVSEGMREEFRESRRLSMPYRLFKEDFKEAMPRELGL